MSGSDAGHYFRKVDGERGLFIPEDVAADLERQPHSIDATRRRLRGSNPRRDAVLLAWAVIAAAFRAGAASDTECADTGTNGARSLTTKQAAATIGLKPAAVRRACREGRIPARRHGRDWLIEPEDVELYRRRKT